MAPRTWEACTSLGLVMWTTSTEGSASRASTLSNTGGRCAAAALTRARSGEDPATPTTSTPSRRSASVWATPIIPVPITAAFTR